MGTDITSGVSATDTFNQLSQNPLFTIILTILIIGSGYCVLWLRTRLQGSLGPFYREVDSFDKGMQSLLFGFLVFSFAAIYTNYSNLLDIEKIFQNRLNLFGFVIIELIGIFIITFYSILFQFILDEILEESRIDVTMKASATMLKKLPNKIKKLIIEKIRKKSDKSQFNQEAPHIDSNSTPSPL